MAVDATFAPSYTKGVTVAPGVASASTTIGAGSKSLCLTNLSTVVCYVRVSSVSASATTADYPVPAGAQVTISKPQDDGIVSYITAAGTSSLHIIPGEGF